MPNQPSPSADPAEPTGATHVSGGIQATNSNLSAGADIVGRAYHLMARSFFYGRWPGWLNLPVMAITSVQANSDQLFRVNSAAFSILPSADSNQVSNLGWIPLPASVLQPLVDQIGNIIGQNFIAAGGPAVSVPDSPQVTVDVVTK